LEVSWALIVLRINYYAFEREFQDVVIYLYSLKSLVGLLLFNFFIPLVEDILLIKEWVGKSFLGSYSFEGVHFKQLVE
jgi:hypothetical protein